MKSFKHNQPGYKFYVVNVNTISIDSGWEFREDALDAAVALKEEGGVPKLMTKPRVGGQVLDPNDEASWVPKRNNPKQQPKRRYFGSEYEAREYVREHPDGEDLQIRYRHISDDFVVEPRDLDVERENPRFGNPASVVKTKRDERLWKAAKRSAAERGRDGDFDYVMGIFLRMRDRVGGGVRENPFDSAPLDSARAEATYTMWHKKDPNHVIVIDTKCDSDDNMVCVGRAHDIVYRSGKWEKGRKTNDYVHTFDSKPRVYMLDHVASDGFKTSGGRSVESLLSKARNSDGLFAVAELALPLSFTLDDGTTEGVDIAIHAGSRVYGAIDKKTIIISDPSWKLVIIRGGKMHFDERGIVK